MEGGSKVREDASQAAQGRVYQEKSFSLFRECWFELLADKVEILTRQKALFVLFSASLTALTIKTWDRRLQILQTSVCEM